jgi:arsenate reductase
MPACNPARAAAAICLASALLTAAGCSSTTSTASTAETSARAASHGKDHNTTEDAIAMSDTLERYVAQRRGEFHLIPAARKAQLEELGAFVAAHQSRGQTLHLNFVCTHNSRRSHMSQLWAQVGADLAGLDVQTWSGGTEATAFNPRAVAAIERAGFTVADSGRTEYRPDENAKAGVTNPVYIVSTASVPGANAREMTCFSKTWDAPHNPKSNFGAVMVCDSADEACPYVPGAEGRFAITYTDPKVSDNTDAEAATYDERCAQIAREMLYAMDSAARTLTASNAG